LHAREIFRASKLNVVFWHRRGASCRSRRRSSAAGGGEQRQRGKRHRNRAETVLHDPPWYNVQEGECRPRVDVLTICASDQLPGIPAMAERRKVIITCAVTGSIHTPSMSPHLPITPQEIADAAVGAAQAGAAIVHLHARDPVDGHPTQDPKYFREFAADIKRRCDVVLNFTTGGAATMTIEERLQPALQLKPEVASLNMGSMNFGLFPMLTRFKEFRFDWESPTRRLGRSHLQEHVQGHRIHSPLVRRQPHALRSSATTLGTVHRKALPDRGILCRRSSSRASSASWAASARIPTTCCT
jgi:hypothetical protein